jgi:chitin disaccharide deacetylase
MPPSRANELLGYTADARLLIVNADDFGLYQAINEAFLRTLKEGVVRSTTVMTPCPGARRALQLLKEHPDIAFGVHLSVICDIDTYRWGPVAPKEMVPSLINEDGNFYALERAPEFLATAKLGDLESEFRAQIETVLSANLKPTHLDWHCLHAGGRADIFEMTVRLAKEHGLSLRVADQPLAEKLLAEGLPSVEHHLVDSFSLDTDGKSARYTAMLRELPAGLSEWAVHPGLGNTEAQSIDPDGWPVRNADYEFLMSEAAQDIVQEEGIILLNYRALQEVWNAN